MKRCCGNSTLYANPAGGTRQGGSEANVNPHRREEETSSGERMLHPFLIDLHSISAVV
jgi:hypothetical protein